MTFTVEDGTGLSDANALVDVAFVDNYANEMGLEAPNLAEGWGDDEEGTLDDDAIVLKKKQCIVHASRWLSSAYVWRYDPSTTTQSLAWPQAINTSLFAFPNTVQYAVAEAAIKIYQGIKLAADLARGGDIASEKVGPIAISYFEGAASGTTFTVIDNYLKGYTLGGANTTFIQTERL